MKKLMIIFLVAIIFILGACSKKDGISKENEPKQSETSSQEQTKEKNNELTYEVDGKVKTVEASLEFINGRTGYTQNREAVPYTVKMKLPEGFEVIRHSDRDMVKGLDNFDKLYINFEVAFIADVGGNTESLHKEPKLFSKFVSERLAREHNYTDIKEISLKQLPKLQSVYDYYHTSLHEEYEYGGETYPSAKKYVFTMTKDKTSFNIIFDIPQDKVNTETDSIIEAMASTVKVDYQS